MVRVFSLIILIVLSIVSLLVGAYNLDLANDSTSLMILLESRLPRLVAIIISGASMAVAGLLMQLLSRNKFVAPQTATTISSAQLGLIISLVYFHDLGNNFQTLMAFVFALIGTVGFIYIIQKIKFKSVVFVPLVGIMLGSVISSVSEFIAYRNDMVQSLTDWMVGSFSLILKGNYEILYICLPLIIIAFIYGRYFNIVGMGDDFAKNLGINYNLFLILGLVIVSLLTAGVVVTVGSVPFVGLVIPNVVTMLKGDNIKGTLVDTAIFGALFVLVCDIFGRLIIYPYELPIGLTIGVIGSLSFIGLILMREYKWNLSKR